MKKDYDLTTWYFNIRRVSELIGSPVGEVPSFSYENILARTAYVSRMKDALINFIKVHQVKTLGEILVEGNLKPGMLFTHYSNFYCKNLLKHHPDLKTKSKKVIELPFIYTKLDDFSSGLKLRIEYDPSHLVSSSSWSTLQKQVQLFVFCLVKEVKQDEITATPYVFASLIPDMFHVSTKGAYWVNKMEVYPNEFSSFELVNNENLRLKKNDLMLLKNLSENEIKNAFQEILNEPMIQKDWGGERSDLFSTNLKLRNERFSASFLFKGPSKFHPMKMSDLGKNGDQIPRLLNEHSDILVLQHCHEVTPFVRTTFRAFATNLGLPRLFTIIDGYETLRILHAYKKLNIHNLINSNVT